MKHVNYTCDFCGVVMSEADEKRHVKALSCKSESMAAWDLIKEWPHVCSPCYLHMESKFKSMKSINTQVTNEVLLERALELAGLAICNYQKYYNMSHEDCEKLGIFRSDILDKAGKYEKQFKEAIKEIKASKR